MDRENRCRIIERIRVRMIRKKYLCPNGCDLPRKKKTLKEIRKNVWGYDYDEFNFCPCCGSIMPKTLEIIRGFFELYQIHPQLHSAERLLYKSEMTAATREASIVVESILKKKSGLDLHGFDLATKALDFEFDRKTGRITKQPLIAINSLSTESERNEQEGLRYMIMGFFRGIRNIYHHNSIHARASCAITFILLASWILDELDGNSVMKKARWIHQAIDYRKIYEHMPRRRDRIRFRLMMLRRARKRK